MTDQMVDTNTGETPVQQDPKAQAALFAKIAKVMGKLERLPKHGRNAHFNYDFIDDEDVYDAIRLPLAAEGVAFFASTNRVDWIDTKVVVHQTFTFADGKTGVTHSCNWVSEAIDKQDKGIAKACTTGLKYFLLKNFILSTGDPSDDTDNDGATKPKRNGKQGGDPMTQFWATVKELRIDNVVAKSYLDKCKGDATKAKDMLTQEAEKEAA